jgi:hypothetical protein
LLVAACGDQVTLPPQLEPSSGERIKLEQYLYEDGTRQLDPTVFYDTKLHMPCATQTWIDRVQRCVPVTSEAVFTDGDCSQVLGIVRETPEINPSVYVGYNTVYGVPVPARLYPAGDVTEHQAVYYGIDDGVCTGPVLSPPEAVFVTLGDEIAATQLASITDAEVGTGRLALDVRTTSDGLFVPAGLRDRVLDVPCTPVLHDGAAACEPRDVLTAFNFADASCTVPAILLSSDDVPSRIVRVVEPTSGCTTYHELGPDLQRSVWQRSGSSCIEIPLQARDRAIELAPAAELAVLDRTIEDAPGSRRLVHVELSDVMDPGLRFTGDNLVDRAMRAECRRQLVDDVERCVPAVTIASSVFYTTPTCTVAVQGVEVSARTCGDIEFATVPTDDDLGVTFHAIGGPVTSAMYVATQFGCEPYTAPPATVLHEIGGALPPEAFPSAQRYGER